MDVDGRRYADEVADKWLDRVGTAGMLARDRTTRLGRGRFAFDFRLRKRECIETFCSEEMKP